MPLAKRKWVGAMWHAHVCYVLHTSRRSLRLSGGGIILPFCDRNCGGIILRLHNHSKGSGTVCMPCRLVDGVHVSWCAC
jgi:hypothetical protein